MTYINAVNASIYFIPELYKGMTTKQLLHVLAASMARHGAAQMRAAASPATTPAASGTRSGTNFNYRPSARQHVSIDGGPPSRESPCKHVLIPLSQLAGYKGHKQQRCHECNELASWCCSRCSSGTRWLALHPPVTQGCHKKPEGIKRGCLAAHRANPAGGGYAESHEKVPLP